MRPLTIGYLASQSFPDAILDFKRHAEGKSFNLAFRPIPRKTEADDLMKCDFLFLQSQIYRWEWLEVLLQLKRSAPNIPAMVLVPEGSLREGCSVMRSVPSVILIDDPAYFVKTITRVIESRQMRSKQVLFVDDDENVLNGYRHTFFRAPWRLHTASGARMALELLAREAVDLVVTDIKMPGMHGLELIEEIRKINPTLPIIVCSGFQGLRADSDMYFYRVLAFMEKPVEMPVLEKKISEVLT
jgi:CheY-like chemotaxis protein